MILDNCRIHKTPEVLQTAEVMDIHSASFRPIRRNSILLRSSGRR